jgi:hypothetical protein
MKMKINIVISLIVSCLCHNATAALITFDDNIIGDRYGNGSFISGSFDINSYLTGDDFNYPYDINSISLTFNFRDDDNDVTSQLIQTQYSFWFDKPGYTAYYRRLYTQYNDAIEHFHVRDTENNKWKTATSNYHSMGQKYIGLATWDGQVANDWYATLAYTDEYKGFGGSRTISTGVSADQAQTLRTTGILGYHTYIEGDGYLVSAKMTIDVEPNPAIDVPEPSTLAIFALGMMGLASRRFKKEA